MDNFITLGQIDQIAQYIREKIEIRPHIAIILGSGLGKLAETVEDPTIIPYRQLPN